jgi:protein-S-isoprenylcysteine O-methyltransferase Ste14
MQFLVDPLPSALYNDAPAAILSSLFLFFGGISVAFPFVWSTIPLVAVVLYVNAVVIPMGEEQLWKNFEGSYDQCCRRVRRWV